MSITHVYVATSSKNWAEAQDLIRFLDNMPGVLTTYDWTLTVEEYGSGTAGITPDDVLLHAAIMDARGVEECDVFILLPHPELYGAMAELGMALAGKKKIWLMGQESDFRFSVFFRLPVVRFIPDRVELQLALHGL